MTKYKLEKSNKAPKKQQGINANTKQLSDDSQKPNARTQDRGLGSSFAYAIGGLLNGILGDKGSQKGFLGVDKKSIDPKEYAHSINKKGEK